MGYDEVKKETVIIEDFRSSLIKAKRTAFISRFIVLREKKRSKAQKLIEHLTWQEDSTAEDLLEKVRAAYKAVGEDAKNYEPDLRKAMQYAKGLYFYFVPQYAKRATLSFVTALEDYEKSKSLLYNKEEEPETTGWRMPSEIRHELSAGHRSRV